MYLIIPSKICVSYYNGIFTNLSVKVPQPFPVVQTKVVEKIVPKKVNVPFGVPVQGMYNINGTNFPAPDAHFDNTCLLSDARGQNIILWENYLTFINLIKSQNLINILTFSTNFILLI